MNVGDKVRITPTPKWLLCKWWPQGEVTGTVQKMFKNGTVAVGVDQLRNGSEDGKKTLHFQAAELSRIDRSPGPQMLSDLLNLRRTF